MNKSIWDTLDINIIKEIFDFAYEKCDNCAKPLCMTDTNYCSSCKCDKSFCKLCCNKYKFKTCSYCNQITCSDCYSCFIFNSVCVCKLCHSGMLIVSNSIITVIMFCIMILSGSSIGLTITFLLHKLS